MFALSRAVSSASVSAPGKVRGGVLLSSRGRQKTHPPPMSASSPRDHPVGVMPRSPLSFDPTTEGFWVFGYGSIVWKVGFEYEKRVICCAPGYRRRFYQGSTDHRGTVALPGRTVTLEPCDPSENSPCWGAAYLVSKENACEVLNLLEIREKQYDKRVQIDLFDASDALIIQNALTYIATPDPANWNWLGEPRGGLPESAMQIATAIGPSGPNSEYLFNLCDAMRGIGVDDPHLYELEKAVREILRRKECI